MTENVFLKKSVGKILKKMEFCKKMIIFAKKYIFSFKHSCYYQKSYFRGRIPLFLDAFRIGDYRNIWYTEEFGGVRPDN